MSDPEAPAAVHQHRGGQKRRKGLQCHMIHLSPRNKRVCRSVEVMQQVQRACCRITVHSLPACVFRLLFLSARMETSQDLCRTGSLLIPATITQTSLPIMGSGARGRRHACRREHLVTIAGYGSPQQNRQHASPAVNPRLRAALCYPQAFSLLSPPVQFVRSLFVQMMLLLHVSQRG